MGKEIKHIGVLCSGGDAPGMNAAIRAVVRTGAHFDLHVHGIYRGYDGLIDGEVQRVESRDVANIMHKGGTVLKTARSQHFRTKEGRKSAYETIVAHDLDAIVAIGGNGTFTGAKIFEKEFGVPMIGVPGTIDNDLYGTDFTIGFDTAINTAVEAVDRIRDTADSHNRLFFIEVMGRHNGSIALYTGIGGGAGGILIPERATDVDELMYVLQKMVKRKKLFGLIVVAEGNENGSCEDVAAMVRKNLTEYEVKVAVIGYMQRGGSPTAMDRVLAGRMGHGAVKGLLEGRSNVMCGIHNNKVVYTSLNDAIKKKKKIDKDLLEMAEILAI